MQIINIRFVAQFYTLDNVMYFPMNYIILSSILIGSVFSLSVCVRISSIAIGSIVLPFTTDISTDTDTGVLSRSATATQHQRASRLVLNRRRRMIVDLLLTVLLY
eukprot:scpid38734/ scgid7232/ 